MNTCVLENSWGGQEGRCLSLYNFCKTCLKRPGFVPCQNSSSDTLQTSVHEDSALLARLMVCILLHLICILPAHQAAVASVPYIRVASLHEQHALGKDMSPLLQSEHRFLSFLCRNFLLYQPNSATPAWSRLSAMRTPASYVLHRFTPVEDLGLWSTAGMLPPQHSALSGTSPQKHCKFLS